MNRVTALTGTKYPIIQAPMGWITRSKLASAVSNADALGIIETSSGEIETCIAEAYKVISKRTGKMINGTFVKDE